MASKKPEITFTIEELTLIESLLPVKEEREYDTSTMKDFADIYLKGRIKKYEEAGYLRRHFVRRELEASGLTAAEEGKEPDPKVRAVEIDVMIRVAMLYGWCEKWNDSAKTAEMNERFNGGTFPDDPLFHQHPSAWVDYVRDHKPYQLPVPLPHVFVITESRPLGKIQMRDEAIRKGKIVLPERKEWDWVKQNMHIPSLTVFDAPNGTAFSIYEEARENRGWFFKEYEKKFNSAEEQAAKIKLRRHLEDDDRRVMPFLADLAKERKRKKEAKARARGAK